MKVWARQLALGLLLTAAIPAAAVRAADSAEQILLDKADYWRLKERPDLARESLDKLLALNPGQPQALYAYGVLELQLGNVAEAQKFLIRLQKIAPQDSRAADLETAIRAGRIDSAALGEARKLGQSGDYPGAVRKYQETFKGSEAPSTYGVEYYLTLAATPTGRDRARRALERMAQTAPNDVGIKLALAEVSTYSEANRASGIAALAKLSNDPTVGPAAVRAWHQALLWLGGTHEARALYEQYLARFPQDTEIRQHLAAAPPDSEVADKGSSIDYQAYVALQQGSLAGAESQFTAALRLHPNDGDARAGLGMVRLRQGRFVEARDLLGRAIKAVPARQPEWATAYDSAVFWASVKDAKALVAAGNYQRARADLTALLAHRRADNWGAELLLAEVEGKLGNKPGAERAYRQALAAKPQNTDAIVGLATVLTAEGKSDEATVLAGRLSAADRARIGGGATTQSEALRTAAKDAAARGDPAAARDKFRQAVAADPNNPWLRLDFARFLAGIGAAAQGFAAVDPNQSGNTPTSLQAAAIFDDEQHRPADALAKLDRIPATARTADMSRFRSDIAAAGTIERARMLANAGKHADARKMLVALFHDPEIKPADRRNIPHMLATLGDTDAAAQLYREAAAQRGPDGTRAAIDYAWLLLKAGDETQAGAVVAQIDAGGGAASANSDLQILPDLRKLKVALAVRKADTLRRRGDTAGAVAQLTPLLGANPGDAGLLLAVGRAYAEAGQHRQARQYFETAYRRNPGNTDALAALIDGAIQSHDTGGARRYLGEAMSAYPNNARFYYLQAQLARAEGDTRAALRALETARTLNGQRPETAGKVSSTPGSGSSLPPVEVPDWAGSSTPQAADAVPAPLETTAKSADSDDLIAAPATSRVKVASLPPNAATDGVAGADAVATAGGGTPRPQLAQFELAIPGPVGGYQPPTDSGPMPVQDSLQLDIERSMAAIEAESSPMIQGGIVFRGREGQSGLSALTEIGTPIEGRFSPWLTGTMTVNVSPVWLGAGSLDTASLSQFGANNILSARGLTQVAPGEQNAFGVMMAASYAFGPYSAKIGEVAFGFPVTNLIGNVAYQPKFLNDTLSVRIEALRQPVTDSVLSYAGTKANLTTANAITNGAFGPNRTWGGVVKTGLRGSVYYDDNDIGGFASLGGGYLTGTNVPANGTLDASVGAYFRPYRSDTDALRVGVSLSYFGFDKNLSFYSFGQGGYFSPQHYEALTFPVEYQGRTGRWSYLAAVALGIQHFNSDQSPFFPNNPFAQQALVAAAGTANAVYPGTRATGLATDLRAQVEYEIDKSLSVGLAAQYDNGHSYNEGTVKLYVRKTFSDPPAVTAILPGTPMDKPQ